MSKNLYRPSRWSRNMLSNQKYNDLRKAAAYFGIKPRSLKKEVIVDTMLRSYRSRSL